MSRKTKLPPYRPCIYASAIVHATTAVLAVQLQHFSTFECFFPVRFRCSEQQRWAPRAPLSLSRRPQDTCCPHISCNLLPEWTHGAKGCAYLWRWWWYFDSYINRTAQFNIGRCWLVGPVMLLSPLCNLCSCTTDRTSCIARQICVLKGVITASGKYRVAFFILSLFSLSLSLSHTHTHCPFQFQDIKSVAFRLIMLFD